ncbi:MAG TPA: DUF72 domain-containing protein [Candidatus Dormibacteraeota bacterium]|nr:DUF72 domain-containing protein [Candidatus Dormibacteraeota bacterium]
MEKQGKILTGTASWSDPGFVESWYPPKLPASQRLVWYAEHFNLVEVNSTFYRVPEARLVKSWANQTPPGFIFDIKLHRLLSRHSTKVELLPPAIRPKAVVLKGRVQLTSKIEKAVADAFLRGIEPLRGAGKLGALLLQLSPEFSPRNHHLEELDHIAELLRGYRLAIELRNAGWLADERIAETKTFFTKRHLTFVMVDGPADPHFMVLPSIDLVTNRQLSYFRAHGRNASGYVRGRTVATRFDYDYPKTELHEIAERAVHAAEETREVHVIYNNNKADYAPRAAAKFQKILHEDFPAALPKELERKELAYA